MSEDKITPIKKLILKGIVLTITGTFVVLAITAGLVFFLNNPSSLSKEAGGVQTENIQKEVILVIDYGEGNPLNSQVEFRDGMTVFDLLKEKADQSGIALKTKTYDIGVLIEAIGEKENSEDGKYWLYYVNGELPMVSSDKNTIKAGDKVEFKFETP